MKKLLISAILSNLVFASAIHARTYEMPAGCEVDGSAAYDFSISNLTTPIDVGYDIYQDPSTTPQDRAEYASWVLSIIGLLNSFDSVKVSGPKHVLSNETFRAKADAFLDPYVNVKFSNSEFGYVGTDKTNLEMNAYKNMSFSNTYGVGLIWAHRGSGLCSSQTVWVQEAPEILTASDSYSNGSISANINYFVDNFSKAALDVSTNVKITLSLESDLYSTSSTTTGYSSNQNGSVIINAIPHAGGGPYRVTAKVYDGNYEASYDLGEILVPGASIPPCEGCNPN